MVTLEDIKSATTEFLARHWNSERLARHKLPQWSGEYGFLGVRPEAREMQGCYAFLEGEQVVYIGSAVSRGRPPYEECGIGARLNQYTTWDRDKGLVEGKRAYRMKHPSLQNVTSIVLIGFPSGLGYLALALEAYLISRFKSEGLKNVKSVK